MSGFKFVALSEGDFQASPQVFQIVSGICRELSGLFLSCLFWMQSASNKIMHDSLVLNLMTHKKSIKILYLKKKPCFSNYRNDSVYLMKIKNRKTLMQNNPTQGRFMPSYCRFIGNYYCIIVLRILFVTYF